jgi:exonuclease SbcC
VEAARQRLEVARRARSEAEAVAKASADANARVHARQTEVEHHAETVRGLAAAIGSHDATAERQRGERAGKLDRHADLTRTIGESLARWIAALPANDAAPVIAGRRALASDATPIAAGRGSVASDPAEPGKAPAQKRTPKSRASSAAPEGAQLLADARAALGAIAAAWRVHAEIVADLDASLALALASIDTGARDADRAFAEQSTRRDEADRRREGLVAELTVAAARLETERVGAGFEAAALRELLAGEPGRVDVLASRLDALDRAADRARTLVAERVRLVADHEANRPFALDEAGAPCTPADAAVIADAARTAELAAAVAQAEAHAATLAATLAADADARARRTAALAEAESAEKAAEVDRVLGQVIGSHDGKLFRSFAQSLTLDGLLAVANSHLEELAPRYQLERVPKHDLELQVVDRDLGGEVRSVQSLSGGESFLVSLALALGLSSMSAHDVRVRTLLIDEGFGTLDPATLDAALAVLDALQATGRQVGVISHVPALVERVGAHVRVFPRGGGRSEVVVAQA